MAFDSKIAVALAHHIKSHIDTGSYIVVAEDERDVLFEGVSPGASGVQVWTHFFSQLDITSESYKEMLVKMIEWQQRAAGTRMFGIYLPNGTEHDVVTECRNAGSVGIDFYPVGEKA